jgi:sugar-specific transcriptional regulator TrmB
MDIDEIEGILREIGLADEEIKIYLAMLKIGSSLASTISEETKINRSHVYQVLERLIIKGFVGYAIRENRKYFSAVHPNRLLDLVKEKEAKLKSALPALLALASVTIDKPVVEIFEGKEGIKTILNDILRTKKEWLAFGSSGKGKEILSFSAEHFETERERLKIHLRGILDNSVSGIKRGKELAQRKFTQILFMAEEYQNPSSTWIYGDRIVFVIWEKEHSFAIRVVSKELTDNYRRHFEVLWKNAKRQDQ